MITTRPLPAHYVGEDLGKFSLEHKGRGICILSGIYQIGDKTATRCYSVKGNFSWIEYLKLFGNRSKIPLREHRVVSWIEAVFRERFKDINVFKDIPKFLDLNNERKRIWLNKTNAEKLLSGLEYSIPHWVWE